MRHVVMSSAGACSYAAGKKVARENGTPSDLLFADTLIEDADAYRFLIEGSADILGLPASVASGLRWGWETIPDIGKHEERHAHLARLAGEAMNALPGLHWAMDGRNPWQVWLFLYRAGGIPVKPRDVPNDQWEDSKSYPKGDPRTLKAVLDGMLYAARDDVRTLRNGHIQDPVALHVARGKVEAFEEVQKAVTAFMKG